MTWSKDLNLMKSYRLGKIFFLATLTALVLACEERTDNSGVELTANIAGYDQNCATCLLSFPDDKIKIQKEFGISPGELYNAINLSRDNFQIGQKIKVKIRKPETNELKACLTMFPSENYITVSIIEFSSFNNLILNDTVDLFTGECLYDPIEQFYICMDSVLGDSRCPVGAYCFWEGNAEVRFKFEKLNEEPVLFNLNTHRGFTNDTIISNNKIALVGVSPYPSLERSGRKIYYKARIVVTRQN